MFLESGLLIFNIIQGSFAHSGVRLEIVMDDHAFPSYSTGKTRTRQTEFGESTSKPSPLLQKR